MLVHTLRLVGTSAVVQARLELLMGQVILVVGGDAEMVALVESLEGGLQERHKRALGVKKPSSHTSER